jgi:hypothetical protein
MKAIIRIPTVQFGYIELQLDEQESLTVDVVNLHNEMVAKYEAKKAEVQKLKDDNF